MSYVSLWTGLITFEIGIFFDLDGRGLCSLVSYPFYTNDTQNELYTQIALYPKCLSLLKLFLIMKVLLQKCQQQHWPVYLPWLLVQFDKKWKKYCISMNPPMSQGK